MSLTEYISLTQNEPHQDIAPLSEEARAFLKQHYTNLGDEALLDLIKEALQALKEAQEGTLKVNGYPVEVDMGVWALWWPTEGKYRACLAGCYWLKKYGAMGFNITYEGEISHPDHNPLEFLDSLRDWEWDETREGWFLDSYIEGVVSKVDAMGLCTWIAEAIMEDYNPERPGDVIRVLSLCLE